MGKLIGILYSEDGEAVVEGWNGVRDYIDMVLLVGGFLKSDTYPYEI